ncbi:MAG: FHA domain-containing protein [Nitrospinota bacterium]|nr:FHA domain-containing protein [Nitrospinota bacterium]MDH5677254.1 FHA domain-containing protein [Nitrospinota bacterium]MDH5756263.1 FHA domain-containing protein [Nitrospinota bacterium]
MAKLTIATKEKVLKEVDINKTIIIGREKGDIILKNPAISAKHLKIEKLGNRYIAHDLDSTNGTFVNEAQITTQELSSGDVIRIGRFTFTFDNPEESGSLGFEEEDDMSGKTMMIDTSKMKSMLAQEVASEPAAASGPAAKLFLHQTSGAPKVAELSKPIVNIGSGDDAEIQIKGITIGKIAATIKRSGAKYEIIFKGGMARVKFDNKNVDRKELVNGDKFSIGSYNFEFRTEL